MFPKYALRLKGSRQFWSYQRRYPWSGESKPHGLPGELVVSLTSYPPRFPLLDLTLRSLLNQTVRPDRVILWLAEEDEGAVPSAVRRLAGKGVEIKFVPNLKSFKKLIFALEEMPDAFIVTVDDDIFYVPNWLEGLVTGYRPEVPTIICQRAHRFPRFEGPEPPAYRFWERDIQDESARHPSVDVMPTGVGGVLYPPRSLHPDVLDREAFMRLCPRADDLWFYWCARRAGALYQKVGGVFPLLFWENSQDESLFSVNQTGNDQQVRNLLHAYGNPTSF